MATTPREILRATHCILDLGCTRAMGSRRAIEKLVKVASSHGLECEMLPTYGMFSFANGNTSRVKEKCRVWFHSVPPTCTDFDIVEG